VTWSLADLGPGWSAIFGAAVGVAGSALVAWKIAKLTLSSEDRRQAAQHKHERHLADQERRQDRLVTASEVILGSTLRLTRALQEWQLGQPVPSFIDEEQINLYLVQLSLFGSDAVRAALREWADVGSELLRVISSLDTLGNRPDTARASDWQAQWDSNYRELTGHQTRLSEKGDQIVDQIRADLGT
jgi:hypothetical protein